MCGGDALAGVEQESRLPVLVLREAIRANQQKETGMRLLRINVKQIVPGKGESGRLLVSDQGAKPVRGECDESSG